MTVIQQTIGKQNDDDDEIDSDNNLLARQKQATYKTMQVALCNTSRQR